GKTTVLRLIAEMDSHASFTGTISASDGAPLTNRIAYMAQSDMLLPWLTLRGNVTIGAKLRGETADIDRAERLLRRVGLSAHMDKKPSALSGGQRQRVALARTLMEDRPVILLDEPFSALDAKTRADMQDLTAEQLARRTVLLVTHDPAEAARLGDQISIMTQTDLIPMNVPHSSAPRPVNDPATLVLQGQLYQLLREGA
ncbi:MAG: ATP-binding cassette domain-containing protein, partial [Pseudoruegeria sp.]